MKIKHKILNKFRFKTALPTMSDKSLEDSDDSDELTRRPSSEEFDPAKASTTGGRRSIRVSKKEDDDDDDNRPRFRLVCFDEEVLVRRVRPVYEIGGTIPRKELWYQEDEYKEIMWKARKSVKRARNAGSQENCATMRGLEYVSNSSARRRSNLDGREAVLDEQFDQFGKDVFPLDDRRIASVYLPFTRAHRVEALERGHRDAEEVREYLYHQSDRNDGSADQPPSQPSRSSPLTSGYSSASSLSSAAALQQQQAQQQQQQGSSSHSRSHSQHKRLSISGAGHSPGMMFTYVDKPCNTALPGGVRI